MTLIDTLVVAFIRFFALYVGLTSSLFSMSYLGNTTASFFARLLTSYMALAICALFGVFAATNMRLFDAHRSSQWATARAFKYTMRIATSVQFKIVGGKEHLNIRPAVFIGNHQTALDVLMLGTIFPKNCSVTAKKSLARTPFLGWFMSLSGTIFIDRANRSTALRAFEGAAEEMKKHQQSVFIFPEGTRSNAEKPELLEFKKGAFHLAIQAGVPIVPVVTGCYSGVLSVKQWRFRGGDIPVKVQKSTVLAPIPTEHLGPEDANELLKYTKKLMLANLKMLAGTAIGRRALAPDPSQLPPLPPAKTSISSSTSSTASSTAAKGTSSGDELREKVVTKEILKDQQVSVGAESVEEAERELEKSTAERVAERGEADSRAPTDM
ncbi:MAG: 1-acylglycerol-3-phosphate O-acyltransferase [Icmadophila ericetorum]|nr:1-acylglycerol-3-phosphate O-acyltransferase [Icmadophila ericetorum]